jgi:signal transduction histidine kinase
VRERLVAAFVGLTFVVVALYGIPRAYSLADLVHDQEQDRLDRTAQLVAVAIDERRDNDQRIDTAFLDQLAGPGEGIVVQHRGGDGARTSDFSTPSGGDIWSTVDIDGGSVTVTLDGDEINDAISHALMPLVLLGLLLVLLSGAAGYALSTRIARPFQDLAAAARGLGTGQLHPKLPDYKIPEAQAIATALRTSGEKLDTLIQHERDFSIHASHELRTPVTALRLDLEDLALWPETPETVAAQLHRSLGELDRLSDAITEMLSVARGLSAESEIDLDLDALIADTVARVTTLGRRVTHEPVGPLPTHLDPAPVVAALELLVGGGSKVRATDRGTHLEVAITMSGQDEETAARRRGAATDLIVAAGGSVSRTTGGVVLSLPKRPLVGR